MTFFPPGCHRLPLKNPLWDVTASVLCNPSQWSFHHRLLRAPMVHSRTLQHPETREPGQRHSPKANGKKRRCWESSFSYLIKTERTKRKKCDLPLHWCSPDNHTVIRLVHCVCVCVYKNSVLLQTQCLLAATERSKIIKTTVWSSSENKGRIQRSEKALGTTHFQLPAFALTHDTKQRFHILLSVELL